MNETSVASLDASNELLQLQARVKWMDVLMRQNAALEGEVSRLCEELDEATRGVLKRGYLYKYRYVEITIACHLTAFFLMLDKGLQKSTSSNPISSLFFRTRYDFVVCDLPSCARSSC
jgi:hypothetical protein